MVGVGAVEFSLHMQRCFQAHNDSLAFKDVFSAHAEMFLLPLLLVTRTLSFLCTCRDVST